MTSEGRIVDFSEHFEKKKGKTLDHWQSKIGQRVSDHELNFLELEYFLLYCRFFELIEAGEEETADNLVYRDLNEPEIFANRLSDYINNLPRENVRRHKSRKSQERYIEIEGVADEDNFIPLARVFFSNVGSIERVEMKVIDKRL